MEAAGYIGDKKDDLGLPHPGLQVEYVGMK